jgi:hypothetical protein
MKRSKELFEYLSQHGMYTRQTGESEDPPEGAETGKPRQDAIPTARARPATKPKERSKPRERADRPMRRREKAAAVASTPSGGEGDGFGERTLVLTYNNLAVGLLLAVALLVLSYFLGFSQGIGDFDGREYAIRMNSRMDSSGSLPTPPDESPNSSVHAGDRPTGEGAEAVPGEGPGGRHGILDEQKVYWTVRAYAAKSHLRTYAEDHLNDLLNRGYDAWLNERRGQVHVCVDRFDDPDDPALDKLVDELRNWKREYPDSKEVVYPFESAFVEEIRP